MDIRKSYTGFILVSNGTSATSLLLVKKLLAIGYNVVTFGSCIYNVEFLIKETYDHKERIFAKCVNITNYKELFTFYNEAKMLYGKAFVLINNFDYIVPHRSLDKITNSDIYDSINTNLVGHMYLTTIVVREMKYCDNVRQGIVINVSPLKEIGMLNASLYNASIVAMNTFVSGLSKDYNIRTISFDSEYSNVKCSLSEVETPFLAMYKLFNLHTKEVILSRNRSEDTVVDAIIYLCEASNSKL